MRKFKNLAYSGADNRPSPFDLYLSEMENYKPLVVFAHGYKGFKDWGAWDLVGEAFAKSGFDFLKFNFSHNGGTVEQPIDFPDLKAFCENTYSKELFDVECITKLVQNGIDTGNGIRKWNKIALIGHSRGGGIVILNAAQNPAISHLATWASVADYGERFNFDLDEWKRTGVTTVKNGRTGQDMPHKYSFYTDFIDNREKLDIEKAARKITVPWIIIHGSGDESVSFENAERLKKWNPKARLVSIPDAGHTFGSSHPRKEESLPEDLAKATEETIRFFESSSAEAV